MGTPLATGKAAMGFDFSNRLTAFSGLVQNELGYNAIPNGPPGSRPGMYLRAALSMCGCTDRVSEKTAKAMNGLVNVPEPPGAERGVSLSPWVCKASEPDLCADDRRIMEYVENMAANRVPTSVPRPSGISEFGDALTRLSQDAAFGRTGIDEGVDRPFDKAERILS